jgi:hypothetical protein
METFYDIRGVVLLGVAQKKGHRIINKKLTTPWLKFQKLKEIKKSSEILSNRF